MQVASVPTEARVSLIFLSFLAAVHCYGMEGAYVAAISLMVSYYVTDVTVAFKHCYIDRFCPDDDG